MLLLAASEPAGAPARAVESPFYLPPPLKQLLAAMMEEALRSVESALTFTVSIKGVEEGVLAAGRRRQT